MIINKKEIIRINLDSGDCCRNNVIVDCEYKLDNTNPNLGNYYAEYRLAFENERITTHLIGMWLFSTEDNIDRKVVDWFEENLLPDIDENIRFFEDELEEIEERFLERMEEERSCL